MDGRLAAGETAGEAGGGEGLIGVMNMVRRLLARLDGNLTAYRPWNTEKHQEKEPEDTSGARGMPL